MWYFWVKQKRIDEPAEGYRVGNRFLEDVVQTRTKKKENKV